jgi:hypothetical protein
MGEKDYYVCKRLKAFWDKNSLEAMKKKNKDKVYIVDGMERCGKSTWAIQQMCYIEPSLMDNMEEFCSRIVFTPEDFYKVCRTVKNGVIIFDEAFRGFASRSAMSKINKKLVLTLMEMGQHNNIVFIILPRIFMLDIYPAMLRSNALFNIYETKAGSRMWRYYNYRDKNKIYQAGTKKGWDYIFDSMIKDNFHGKFPAGKEFEAAYLKKKASTFQDIKNEEFITEEDDMGSKVAHMHDKLHLSYETIGETLGFSDGKARNLHRKWLSHHHVSSNIIASSAHRITPHKKEKEVPTNIDIGEEEE